MNEHKAQDKPAPQPESVWDYPRPPRVEACGAHIVVVFNGEVIADTRRAKRVLETSHPPVYYIPPQDVKMEYFRKYPGKSWCEWKGHARYYSIKLDDKLAESAAWSYPNPTPDFAAIKDHIAFYAGPMDACYVDDELVTPQPGGYYGGWITRNIIGPFKGEPESGGW